MNCNSVLRLEYLVQNQLQPAGELSFFFSFPPFFLGLLAFAFFPQVGSPSCPSFPFLLSLLEIQDSHWLMLLLFLHLKFLFPIPFPFYCRFSTVRTWAICLS